MQILSAMIDAWFEIGILLMLAAGLLVAYLGKATLVDSQENKQLFTTTGNIAHVGVGNTPSNGSVFSSLSDDCDVKVQPNGSINCLPYGMCTYSSQETTQRHNYFD